MERTTKKCHYCGYIFWCGEQHVCHSKEHKEAVQRLISEAAEYDEEYWWNDVDLDGYPIHREP